MKTSRKHFFLLPVLIAGLGWMLAGQVTGQTFTLLHSFNGNEGAYPDAGLILSGDTLYGTCYSGGSNANGTVFALNTDGTGFTNLHSFTATYTNRAGAYTNSDGANSAAGLLLSGNTLYGTCYSGGSNANGTVFALKTDGTGFTTLHSFTATDPTYYTNSDGANPEAGLILSGNTLYGTASAVGPSDYGTVFAVTTGGTGFRTPHEFTGGSDAGVANGLILSGNTLYGTTQLGGSWGCGTLFAVNTNGMGFTNLHTFTAAYTNRAGAYTNSDGACSSAGLVLSGNTLYGTCYSGGTNGNGTVFALNTNDMGITNLHTFTATYTNRAGAYTNSDGANPDAGLVLSGNTLYGTTYYGGTNGNGTVFALKTDGTAFTPLHSFTALDVNNRNSDGANAAAGLALSDNTLYGTTYFGGTNGNGTVFSIFIQPQLSVSTHSGANVVLTWPTNYAGFTLQCTTNLDAPAVWITNSSPPVIVNGQFTVTNLIGGTQQFYRLSQ